MSVRHVLDRLRHRNRTGIYDVAGGGGGCKRQIDYILKPILVVIVADYSNLVYSIGNYL